MIFDRLLARRGVRRWLPWVVWALALAAAVPLLIGSTGLGVAPAVVEVRKVTLSSPAAATLAEVLVTPGSAVKKGDPLIRLDASDLDSALAVARADLQRLELEIPSKEVALHDERKLTLSRLASEAERSALDVSQLVAETERDRSELAQLREQITREEKLVADKLARTDTLNALVLRRVTLSRKVDEAEATIRQARANAAATAQRLGEWRSSSAAGTPSKASSIESQVAPGRAAADAQRERLRQLELQRSRLELKSPFDGRVGDVLLRVGEFANEGTPVVTVVDDHPVTAIAYVEQRWAWRVRIGDRAVLAPSDRSGPNRAGTVVALGASIDELPVRFRAFPTEPAFGRQVFLQLDAPAPLPGQVFNATFTREETGAP